jgi:hypothetical protein
LAVAAIVNCFVAGCVPCGLKCRQLWQGQDMAPGTVTGKVGTPSRMLGPTPFGLPKIASCISLSRALVHQGRQHARQRSWRRAICNGGGVPHDPPHNLPPQLWCAGVERGGASAVSQRHTARRGWAEASGGGAWRATVRRWRAWHLSGRGRARGAVKGCRAHRLVELPSHSSHPPPPPCRC